MNTKTKTKQTVDISFELPQDKGSLVKSNQKKSDSNQKTKFEPKKREKLSKDYLSRIDQETLQKGKNYLSHLDQKLKDLGIEKEEDLDNIHDLDQDLDRLRRLAGVQKPKQKDNLPAKIENLPKKISQELTDNNMVVPEWTMVKDLPGYMKGSIRAFGRKVMEVLAPGTPLEKIYVITTVGGLNSDRELNAVANFLKNNGIEDVSKSGKILDLLPGYNPLVKVYKALGYNWLIVQDFAGKYIYVGEDPKPFLLEK